MSKQVIFHKEYHGFEDVGDIERDVSEMWDGVNIPGEFQGTITVTVEYTSSEDEEIGDFNGNEH